MLSSSHYALTCSNLKNLLTHPAEPSLQICLVVVASRSLSTFTQVFFAQKLNEEARLACSVLLSFEMYGSL